MKEADPGHSYELDSYDGGVPKSLVFMKRKGPKYPGNTDSYSGTNCQEVLRALIARVKYLDCQISCPENQIILNSLRDSINAFEIRAAKRHRRDLNLTKEFIEDEEHCSICGHISCLGHK